MFITMPQLGETVTEGTIVTWLKALGDRVAEDEALFEVSTDKVDTEVPAATAGVLTEILVAEGETAPVGARLAVLTVDGETAAGPGGEPDDEPGTTSPPPGPTRPVPPRPAPHESRRDGPAIAPGARVTGDEVAARIAARARPLSRPASASPTASRTPSPTPVVAEGDTVEPLSAIRRRTGAHMRASIETSAHTLVVMQADYLNVDRVRTPVQDEFRAAEGFGLSYLPFVARAVVDALQEYPRVNAAIADDALVVHRDVHLGIAVDLDFEGLIVPIVRDAGTLRLRPLARAIHDRSAAARARTLTPDDVTGGTFTLTNAGGYGTLVTAPIINQPQVAIISTDGVAMRPVAVATDDGHGLAVHPVGNFSLSFDHRAFDGAYASAFLQRVVAILETRRWAEELA
jgi:pyruvate dehydrogenase E2 component (dihydrolipoamide acetyltransferase)